jgi:hypothetical protein
VSTAARGTGYYNIGNRGGSTGFTAISGTRRYAVVDPGAEWKEECRTLVLRSERGCE